MKENHIYKRIHSGNKNKINKSLGNNIQIPSDENICQEEADLVRKDSISPRNDISLDINTLVKYVDENMETNVQRNDDQVPVDINTLIKYVDENTETNVQRNDDVQVPLDINTLVRYVDENTETNVQRNDDVQVPLDINTLVRYVDENTETNVQRNDDVQVPLDINTFVRYVDENTEINVQRNDDVQVPLDINTFVSFVNANGNNEAVNEAQNNNYNYVENSELSVILDMCYDGTPASLDHCVRKLSFDAPDAADVCVPIVQNTNTTCNKDDINRVPSPIQSPTSFSVSASHNTNNDSSESEYLPSEDELRSLDLRRKKKLVTNTIMSSISSADVSTGNIISACDDTDMHVEKSNSQAIKRNCCCFCLKLQTQLARHLETVHCDESEVKNFAILPKGNPERKKIIETIRRNGNFKFNISSEVNNGKLIVCRRPNEKHKKSAIDFTVCANCKGFFAKSTIRHHSRYCFKKDFSKNRCIMIMGRKVTCRIHHLASETLKKIVFPVMREDEITRIIRYDELLILYANKLCTKYKAQHQHDMIRARLRVLGRFLLALKKINSDVEDFKSLYYPRIYGDCITAINIVAGYDNEQDVYKTPAVAANLTTLIKHVGNLLITEYIKTDNSEKKKLVKDFLKLLVIDIGTSVNKTVIETQSALKRRKKINLPSMQDIQKLYKHLEKIRVGAYKALKESFSYENWISLAEATLTSVHVFNRRRAGEMERILIEDFKNYERINKNMYSDIYTSLSEKNRKIAENYSRFCIRGKLGRTVPVLLTNELLKCINLILQFRIEVGVPKKNPYVFGLRGCTKNRYRYLRACILMRKFAGQCDAMKSSSLRDTILRKHIATHCIQLNLNDIDISDLATFMGHAEKIHREHYRQPLASRDILKISQYLEAVQGNTKNLNESSSDNEYEEDNHNDVDTENLALNISSGDTSNDSIMNEKVNNKRKRSTSPYGKTKRQRWTEEEKETTLRAFAIYIENLTLPSLREIQQVRKKYSCLSHRTSPQIKTWLHNKLKLLRQSMNNEI